MANYKAVFIGTGMIGAGLGANALLHDFDVTLYDVVSEEQIRKNLKNIFDILVEAGMTTQAIADEKQKTVKISTDLKEALKGGADIVQEAVPEREDLKRSIFRTVQEILGDKTIIVSTTSHYFPSILQKDALYPGNILVAHPYNPSYILPLIEICGPECPKDVIDKVVDNISWKALFTAMDIVEQGVCSVEDVDRAIMFGPGMRMAILGQIMCISLGIDGGIAKGPEKYGLPHKPIYDIAGKGVEEEIANRDPELGNTVESLNKWRDKALVEILKIQKML